MANALVTLAIFALWLALSAIELVPVPNSQCGAGTTTARAGEEAPLLHSAPGQAAAAAAAGGGGGAAHGGALGLAALHALPAAATVTFFAGVMLIVAGAAHARAGAAAGEEPVPGLLRLLTKVTAGMAAALVGFIALALCGWDWEESNIHRIGAMERAAVRNIAGWFTIYFASESCFGPSSI